MDGNHALAVHGLLGERSLRVRHETHAQPEEWGPGSGFGYSEQKGYLVVS